MELVLATNQLTSINGAETYLVTVAGQLEKLGHDVTLYGLELGEMADFARGQGLRVAGREDELPESCDGLLVNDAVAALTLAEHYPEPPQVFVAHSEDFVFCSPPRLPEATSAVVVLNDRIATRLRAAQLEAEVVRLRQPVDLYRFNARGRIRERPRRALLLGNYLVGERREMLLEAWTDAGIECVQVGRHGRPTTQPEVEIADADIVVGHGRAALEGMSSARAVYVFDHIGGDGWVTERNYGAIEADGFAGMSNGDLFDPERLRRDIEDYSPGMGVANRDLALRNHDAADHAVELVALFERLGPRPVSRSVPLREMARLVRLEWNMVGRAEQYRLETEMLRGRVAELELERDRCGHELEVARADAVAYERRAVEAERGLADFKATRRYRATQLLMRPLDAVRRIWRG